MPGRLAALLAACALAVPASAQDDVGPPAPPGAAPQASSGSTSGSRTVASVNNEPITGSDVAYSLRVLSQGGPVDPRLEETIVRRMGEEVLLATEAERLGLDLSLSQVDSYWVRWFGFEPDYEESAAQAGTTVERQRELAKRTVLSELYVYCRVGLMTMPGARIDVDLGLKHMVDVTPEQLRAYFREFRDELGRPETVSVAIYPAPDEDEAARIEAALRDETTPSGPAPIRQEVPLDALPQVFGYAPSLAAFARDGDVGAVSAPTEAPGQAGPVHLVVQVTGRAEAEAADFAAVQDELRNRIQGNLLVQAKREIVRRLARQAVYFPEDLFDEPLVDEP